MGFKTFTIDDYEITREGEVINLKWGRKVKPQPNGKGYLRVVIGKKRCFVHRLVAERYVPNPDGKDQINHKDGNKLNNNADNLEWVTNQENRDHAILNNLHMCGERCPWSKLTQKDVDYIRDHRDMTRTALAEMFCVSRATIRDIQNGKSWKRR